MRRLITSVVVGMAMAASTGLAQQGGGKKAPAQVRAAAGGGAAPASAAGQDWPQWRGPNRDGIAPSSPKLLDAWPSNGPALLWKSEKIASDPSGGANDDATVGGCGSVVVSGGKAFFYAHCRSKTGTVHFSTALLKEWGWVPGITSNLAVKVDKVYQPNARGAEQEAYITNFLATLDPAEREKMGKPIHDSLVMDYYTRIGWDLLYKLSTICDKEFANLGELANAGHLDLNPHGQAAMIINPVNASGSKITDVLFCLDAGTGKELWKTVLPGAMTGGNNYHWGASGTPSITGGRCYFTGSAGVYCLNVADGKTVWQAKTKFSNSSPLVMDGAVFVFLPEGLTAFDAKDGKPLWTQPDAKNATDSASVSPWSNGGKTYLIGYRENKGGKGSFLFSADPATGKIIWSVWGEDGPGYSTPAISGDMAATFGKGRIWAFKLEPDKGVVAWSSKESYDERGGSLIIYQDHVYAVGGGYGNSGAHCYDLKTGVQVWEQKFEHTEGPSPILVDGKIIANVDAHHRSQTVMFRATPEKWEQLGSMIQKGGDNPLNFEASPTVANGRLYLRLKDCIACYELTK